MYHFAAPQHIPQAVQIWCVGNCLFFIGYFLAENASLPSIGLKIGPALLKNLFYIMVIAGLFYIQIGTTLLIPIAIIKVFGYIGIIGVLYFARLWAADESNTRYRNYALILYMIQTYNGIFHSYVRINIILPTLIFYFGFISGKRNLSVLFSYRIIPLFVALGLFINAFKELGGNRQDFGGVLYDLYLSQDGDDADEVVDVQSATPEVDRGGFIDRSSTLAQVSKVVELVEINGFYDGTVSAPLMAAIIPRFLWPEKPKIAIGQWFAVAAGAGYVSEEKTVNNSVNMTIPGEMYIDFGWIGVIIGCFLFGFLIRSMWNACEFSASNYNLPGAIMGGYMLLFALTGISIDLQIVVNYLSFYLVFYIAKKLLCAYFV